MGSKLFALIWLFFVLLVLQETYGLERCWTWTHGESSDYEIQSNKNDTNRVIRMVNTDQNPNQNFGMGCYISDDQIYINCMLTHQDSVTKTYTNCIAAENGSGTPCTKDNRIVFEKVQIDYGVYTCRVTFLHFKNEDLGKWTMIQNNIAQEFEIETVAQNVT